MARAAKKPTSRPERWSDACARAAEALQELVDLQQEYADWRGNLSDNLASSSTAEKLDELANLDLEGALDTVSESESADLPRGFGRD